MTYLAKYPYCMGCPVSKHCGTDVSAMKLCYSYGNTNAEEVKPKVIKINIIEQIILNG